MDVLTRTVQRAIRDAPCSLRALARAAGVPHASLVWVQQGRRRATPALAAKVARALTAWEAACRHGARRIRQAQPRRPQ